MNKEQLITISNGDNIPISYENIMLESYIELRTFMSKEMERDIKILG